MRPKVIHPTKVILHRRGAIEIDSEFGPTGKIEWSEPIELYGQVRYEKYEQLIPVGDGNDPMNDGHIVFYTFLIMRLHFHRGAAFYTFHPNKHSQIPVMTTQLRDQAFS